MSTIELQNLTKSFGDLTAVNNVSLKVDENEVLCLLGPSGCGKTTTLRMVAGLEIATSGNILINNNNVNELETRDRNLAMAFQFYALYPSLTVGENLANPLYAENLSEKEIKDKIFEIADILQLREIINRKPHQLAEGEKQRVAVARSLVFDPQLVLMDEPLGALDKNLRESMQYEIKHIHESIGVTVVYVTHDQSEALTMSNRIAVFNDGKVQQLSSPDELYEKPVNSFVAEFIGENNTFAGEVSDISGGKCKVKLANADILANPISVKGKGERTTVSIRPERALINPTDKMDNIHKGKIEEVIYHGDHTRVRINLLGNSEFILKVPNSSSNLDIKLGNEIKIGWNSDDARALDPK